MSDTPDFRLDLMEKEWLKDSAYQIGMTIAGLPDEIRNSYINIPHNVLRWVVEAEGTLEGIIFVAEFQKNNPGNDADAWADVQDQVRNLRKRLNERGTT